jgi:hypothetical protein
MHGRGDVGAMDRPQYKLACWVGLYRGRSAGDARYISGQPRLLTPRLPDRFLNFNLDSHPPP